MDFDELQSYGEISARVDAALAALGAGQFRAALRGYRLVRDARCLDAGKHVRWIRRLGPDQGPLKLTAGGIAVDVQDANMRVLCINRKIIKVEFGACVVFQKLSPDELLVARALDA